MSTAVSALPRIEVSHLTVNYKEKNREFTALHDVNFTVADGEFVSIIGASGCGKSGGIYRKGRHRQIQYSAGS